MEFSCISWDVQRDECKSRAVEWEVGMTFCNQPTQVTCERRACKVWIKSTKHLSRSIEKTRGHTELGCCWLSSWVKNNSPGAIYALVTVVQKRKQERTSIYTSAGGEREAKEKETQSGKTMKPIIIKVMARKNNNHNKVREWRTGQKMSRVTRHSGE